MYMYEFINNRMYYYFQVQRLFNVMYQFKHNYIEVKILQIYISLGCMNNNKIIQKT